MKRIILSLVMAIFAMTNIQAQQITINKTGGEKIQWNLHDKIQVKKGADGKPVWVFDNTTYLMPQTTISDISSIKVYTKEETEAMVRQALIDFYNAMDGPNWTNKENWLSDKPVNEWYGVSTENGWVSVLRLNVNNLKGALPDCILNMGPIREIELGGNQITGIPDWFTSIYSLRNVSFGNMGLNTLPESLFKLPIINTALLRYNNFSGAIPEIVTRMMDNPIISGMHINLGYNKFTSIPDAVKNHPRFGDFWPGFLSSNPFTTPIKDANDNFTITIPAPVFSTKDIYGKTFNTGEIYKKNKYTLLIKWCAYMDLTLMNNICLAYNQLKSNVDGEGLGVIALYHHDEQENGELDRFMTSKGITNDSWYNSKYDVWTKDYYEMLGYGMPLAYHLVDQQGHIVYSTLIDAEGRGTDDDNYDHTYETKLLPRLESLFNQQLQLYTSTDFSKDGVVTQLQEASVGDGVDIVFVGEGFVDKDMEPNGAFDQKMQEAMEQFFAIEPYTSLRNRFNVYAVKAVSKNEEFIGGAEHAIDEDVSKALEYAQNVGALKANAPMRVNVVYKNNSGGRSYCIMMEDRSYVCFAMSGASPVLNHEAGGHGVGLLFDEYVEPGYEEATLPESQKVELYDNWQKGYGLNVDYHDNPAQVKWAHFINDTRYAGENLGAYEGSWTYGLGAYRPTQNSIMRESEAGLTFNAPSREAIYKQVMQDSEGTSWTYDYETFVAFDEAGRTEFVNSLSSSARQKAPKKGVKKQQQFQTAPPVFIKGTWRDALKKK